MSDPKKDMEGLVNSYNVVVCLRCLVECINDKIDYANIFGVADEALCNLEEDLAKALNKYSKNNNEFGKKNE